MAGSGGDPGAARPPGDGPIVVYDGHCALCSGWVRFVLRRDGARARPRFASAQSLVGQALLSRHG